MSKSYPGAVRHRSGDPDQLPFLRLGIPTFDRLGAAHRVSVGYRGTRNLIFEAGNLFIANQHDATPADWPSLAAAH